MPEWKLVVWNPTGATKIAEYSPSNPGGIVGGFRWQSRADGDSRQLVFQAVPKLVDIPIAAMLQLQLDTGGGFKPVWCGYVQRGWHDKSDGQVREYIAAGASELLRRVYANIRVDTPTDTGALARQLLPYKHPAIVYNTSRMPNSGVTISDLTAIPADLATILDKLAEATPGVSWGVDPDRVMFFRPANGVSVVQYADGYVHPVPVEADNIVDRVRLVWDNGASWVYEYSNVPYYREIAYKAPPEAASRLDLTNYLEVPAGDPAIKHSAQGNWVSTSMTEFRNHAYYLWDGNPDTGLGASGLNARFRYNTTVGVYTLWIRLMARSDAPWRIIGLPSSPVIDVPGGTTVDTTYIVNYPMSVFSVAISTNWGGTVEVYELEVYTPSEYARRIAEARVRLPETTPREIIVPGYVPPNPAVILLGSPAGDIRIPATEYEYEYTVEGGLRTRIYSGVTKAQVDPLAAAIYAAVVRINEKTRSST